MFGSPGAFGAPKRILAKNKIAISSATKSLLQPLRLATGHGACLFTISEVPVFKIVLFVSCVLVDVSVELICSFDTHRVACSHIVCRQTESSKILYVEQQLAHLWSR
jgi:hypothetical protein